MNVSDLNIILSGVVGSTAHGLALEGTDDTDIMGIFVESPHTVCGIGQQDHKVRRTAAKGARSKPGDVDEVYYSLRKFGRLAAAGNPSILVLLFLDDYLVRKQAGVDLLWHRPYFLSKEAGRRFLGYAESQWRRLLKSRGPGANRPELIKAHGYDTKFAMHMTRLAYQGIELMETQRITLPMPEASRGVCMAIRRGEFSYKDVMFHGQSLRRYLIEAIDEADLPERTDRDRINELLWNLHSEAWRRGLLV